MDGHIEALGVVIPILAAAVLYLTSVLSNSWPVSVGDFLVVYMVFIMFQTTIAELGKSFSVLAKTIPIVDQVKPFLTQKPEVTAGGKSVGKLGGNVRLDRVSFRYDADSPLILNGVSIHARLGEFIAITGESGAGKSTLIKLMLGIYDPTSGAVYYDGQDLRHLNKKQVRRQMGVIPQSVELHPEDVWDNIVGRNDDASEESLWRAAHLATIDREIKAMPMQMLTSVGAGLGVTAGGESQRITIARALNGNPRILLLDEATNWLDNESQSTVMKNLAQLNATRIIIAHRLSTLRQADRIYVLHGGRVVETGNFTELMELEGYFSNLVQRQLL